MVDREGGEVGHEEQVVEQLNRARFVTMLEMRTVITVFVGRDCMILAAMRLVWIRCVICCGGRIVLLYGPSNPRGVLAHLVYIVRGRVARKDVGQLHDDR